jgi:signal transduction histidine kinase
MFHNKEFRYFLYVQLLIFVTLCVLVFQKIILPETGFILLGILLIIANTIFGVYRYTKIKQLTEYLVKIQNGSRTLDISDNMEGELSILKNELYKLSLTLNSQAEMLLRDKTYLADSLSDISHQLKTPLTSMLMMVDFLEQDSLPEDKRREFLRNISIGLERMEWLVQALLKLSKLDADTVRFKNESINVYSLLKKAVEPVLIPMEIRGISLDMPQLQETVTMRGDYHWFMEALTNIIKNCMEHTKSDGRITISYIDNNLYTKIVIEDTGVGIDKEDLPHIFERFYKGKNSKSDSVGIGLALSKQIITRQKGSIEVTSTALVGTKFEIKIYR